MNGLYNPNNDKSGIKLKDTRKQKLTLRKLNDLRRIREARKFELINTNMFKKVIYADPVENPGM